MGCGLYAISKDEQVGPRTSEEESGNVIAEFQRKFGDFADSRLEELFEFKLKKTNG